MLLILVMFTSMLSQAQPSNDNCNNASTINITGAGFDKGIFAGTQVDMTAATSQTSEYYAPSIVVSGLNKKSVWYKFSIPTHRSIRVSVGQPGGAIQAGNVGFAVYKTSNCLPGDKDISNKLSPIETFGNTYHPCVDPGDYLVQVSGSNGANGPIILSVEVGESDPAPYDKLTNASSFGKLINKSYNTDFFVECQSIDLAAEVCQTSPTFKSFTKSTWHTFTTPAYFDYLNVWLGYLGGGDANFASKYGYRIFEGDPSLGLNGLKQVGACDSIQTNYYSIGKKGYKCDALKPNTTYTVQVLYHKDFKGNIRFMVDWNGVNPTNAPVPVSSITSPNNMGTLNANASFWGETNSATDAFACNANHNKSDCPSLPKTGLSYQGRNYNLSSFFTFKLATTSTVYFGVEYACSNVLLRLYKKKLTADCKELDSTSLLTTFIPTYGVYNYSPLQCLDSGDYVVQVMGSDDENDFNYLYWNACTYNNLGSTFKLNINVRSEIDINKFSLFAAGKFDKINADSSGNMQPLTPGTYKATPDTFGCSNTVVPDSTNCGNLSKASYREFVVSDSMIMMDHVSSNYYWRVYKADANALATAQGAFSYPKKIKDMAPYTYCATGYYNNSYESGVCLVPGTYTIVSLDDRVSQPSTMEFKIVQPKAKYNAPEKAEDLGDILAKIKANGGGWYRSDLDTFSCFDNPKTIDGVAPCMRGNIPASKLIYRQFYLSKPTTMSFIAGDYYSLQPRSSGVFSLFRGKATDGVDKLKAYGGRWSCSAYMYPESQCDQLPAGWYTIVEYGWGSTYNVPYKDGYGNDLLAGSSVGKTAVIYFNAQNDCEPQRYNRPIKSSIDTTTKQPYLIEWGNGSEHTDAYPQTSKRYVLNTEYFNCANDTDYIRKNLNMCSVSMSEHGKVAFYVFKTTQESYLNIQNIPNGLWAMVYDFDERGDDSSKLKTATPLQACNANGESIEFCKLQPGTYTLVFYVPLNGYTCTSITPWIYVDKIGYSRFDHATKAYDFGSVTPDSTWKKGKDGDINPLDSKRSPSNDFFYCTTGAQENDPSAAACMTIYNPLIYKTGNNVVLHPDKNQTSYYTIDRRNLWYTFKADHPGTIRVRVENKTPGKNGYHQQVPFAVYRSDVDGTLPFDQVVANGQVDSTQLQGLTLVKTNLYNYYCYGNQEIEFYVEPCSFKPARYYILAENRNMYGWDIVRGMNPNHQIEVSVLLDSVNSRPPKFDHYSQAHDMGIVNSGRKKGETDNYTCATRDLPDPIYAYSNCEKTLWYKFTTTTSGTIRYASFFRGQYQYYYDNIQLFRQIKPNDSSSNGLQHLPYTSTYYENGNWAQQCISPGTYYLILPGCYAINEDVFPEIEIIQQKGDFCSNPMIAELNGASSATASTVIDCHTIGTDYGEFNKNLTCPANALTSEYKSSWYRLDVKGTDTLDVTVFIGNRTNVDNTKVKYRMMTGNCGAMQEQSCVQDALTRNTYKCLAPGNSYYIQVFTPVTYNGYNQTTGSIDLNVNAVIHADTCLPADPCIAVANFTPEFDCTKDKDVRFTNFSTYGSDIQYTWDFGYYNSKSSAVSPSFFYPALTVDSTYKIKLVVKNTACGKTDSVIQSITVPARPTVDLGKDTIFCQSGSSISFDVTGFSGTTYYWSNGTTLPTYTASNSAKHFVELTFKGCKARDTVDVWINPISKKAEQFLALCNTTQVSLNASRGYGEQFKWNTNQLSSSVTVTQPGIYWADVYLNTCTIRDSFNVVSSALAPLGIDTTVCQQNLPYTLNAKVSGASSYRWNDNTTNPTLAVSKPGIYWVDITLGGCVFRDSLTLTIDSIKQSTLSANICLGNTYTLPSGRKISIAGSYNDTLYNQKGCDSLVTAVTLIVTDAQRKSLDTTICLGDAYKLPSGRLVTIAGNYLDTLYSSGGCLDLITSLSLRVDSPSAVSIDTVICENNFYRSPSGKIINVAGNYLDTIRNKRGCDSIRYAIKISTLPIFQKDTALTLCQGVGYKLPGGKLVYLPGTYIDTLRAKINGCDSILTTTILAIDSVKQRSVIANICLGQTYTMPGGKLISVAGIYKDTLYNKRGCDSLVSEVTLTVTDAVRKTVDTTICFENTYTLPSGKIISIAGNYKDTLFSVAGCIDTITTLSLKVDTAVSVSLDVTICENSFYTSPSGKKWNLPGIYPDTLKNIRECDSIRYTISLQTSPIFKKDTSVTICNGVGYQLPGGRLVYQSGLYSDTLKTMKLGCDSIINTSLTVLSKIIVSLNQPDPVCSGSSVNLTATVLGGNGGPYVYSWTNSSSTSNSVTVTPIVTTKYKVTVSDGCTVESASDSVTITVNPYPDATITTSAKSVCYKAGINFSNSSNVARYKWVWGTGNVQDTSNLKAVSFTYPSAGTYEVTLSLFPSTGCNISKTETVTILERPIGDINGSLVSCAKDSVSFSGLADKNPISSWIWSFGNGNTSIVQNPVKQVFANAGNYPVRLIIENGVGCRDTITKTIKVNPLPVIGLNGIQSQLCLGSSLKLDAKGGGTYFWSPSTDLSSTTSASTNASPKNDIVYRVNVTSTDGCISNDSISIKVTQPFTLLASVDTFVCVGGSVQLSASGAEKYLWSGTGVNSNANSVTVKPAATSTYTVKGTGLFDCFTFSKDIVVKVIPYPTVDAGNDTTMMVGTVIQLKPLYSSDVSRYSWSPSTFLSCLNCPNPYASPEQPIEYKVTATNAYNCSTSDTRKISLLCNAESVFLPNTFTPNADGVNDVLYPRGEGIKSVKHLRIFNRWGQLVYERLNFNTNDRSMAWDGTFKGQALPPDVFVFSMAVICDNNQLVETKGNVMIVR